jgi:hypothetical protein
VIAVIGHLVIGPTAAYGELLAFEEPATAETH